MKFNLRKIGSLIGSILIVVIILIILLPLCFSPDFFVSDASVGETYTYLFHHPIYWLKRSILAIIILALFGLVYLIVYWGFYQLSKFMIGKSHVDTNIHDGAIIYRMLYGTLIFFLISLFIFLIAFICNGDYFLINACLMVTLMLGFTLWSLFSFLYSETAVHFTRAYFISLIILFGSIFFSSIYRVNITVTSNLSETLIGLKELTPYIILVGLLTFSIKGLQISFRESFIKSFNQEQKGLSTIQIFFIITILFSLILCKHVNFDFSVSSENRYPPINSTK